jgi:hypothetical protein
VNRRGFLKGILATGVAPYVVTTAGVLMPVSDLWKPRGTWLWLLAADEQWNYFKIPTDLDSPVVFHEYTRILGAEAKVPGIGVLPVEARVSEGGVVAYIGGSRCQESEIQTTTCTVNKTSVYLYSTHTYTPSFTLPDEYGSRPLTPRVSVPFTPLRRRLRCRPPRPLRYAGPSKASCCTRCPPRL